MAAEQSLKALLEKGECFSPPRSVAIVAEVLRQLGGYHRTGLLHRNIHAGCVFLNEGDRVRLAGLDLSRLRNDGSDTLQVPEELSGKVASTSPEQVLGNAMDERTDLFQVGLLLYRLLAGQPPFSGAGIWTVAKKVLTHEPAPPSSLNADVPHALDAIVATALAKEPAQRFSSAGEFERRLRTALP